MTPRALTLGSVERQNVGVIVTMREPCSGHLKTVHVPGRPLQALAEIVAEIDASDREWKIASICTPQTIFRDLQGTRFHPRDDRVQNSENFFLGSLKPPRLDLLDWSLRTHERDHRANPDWR